jgi:RHS repeat-associated protein
MLGEERLLEHHSGCGCLVDPDDADADYPAADYPADYWRGGADGDRAAGDRGEVKAEEGGRSDPRRPRKADRALSVAGILAAASLIPLGAVIAAAGPSAEAIASNTITAQVDTLNPRTTIARDRCLVLPAGDGGTYECGALRLAHSVFAVRTLETDRNIVLTYLSEHAEPRVLIQSDVVVSANHADQVRGIVSISGHSNQTFTTSWDNSVTAGTPRRVVVPLDAYGMGLATGVYPYTLQMQSLIGGNVAATTTVSDTFVVVNRAASPFGRGWWIAGVEQLNVIDGNTRLWVGGDGSTRLYRLVATGIYVAQPQADRPDTLVAVGSSHQRKLRNGAYVEFDASGQHVKTRNRQGHETAISYDGSGRVNGFTFPGSGSTYWFPITYPSGNVSLGGKGFTLSIGRVYVGTGSLVDSVTDGASKVTKYQSYSGGRPTVRVNRRGHSTTYTFDAALRLSGVSRAMGSDPAIVTSFCAQESRTISTCESAPIAASDAATWAHGPRSGQRWYYKANRFGAVVSALDPADKTAQIRYENPSFPLLATKVIDRTGFTTSAAFNSRGLLDSVTQHSPYGAGNAVTKCTWHSSLDVVTSIKAPLDSSYHFNYDSQGNRSWEQAGPNDSTRVNYSYNSLNQLEYIQAPGAPTGKRERLEYDTTLGNVGRVTSPEGVQTTVTRNAIGVETGSSSLLEPGRYLTTSRTYDRMWRVTAEQSVGDGGSYTLNGTQRSFAAESLFVENTYDDEGNVTQVRRRAGVPSPIGGWMTETFSYDPAHRKTGHTAPGTPGETFQYDEAGNVTRWITARQDTIRMGYDLLDRLVWRKEPATTVTTEQFTRCTGCLPPIRFPYWPLTVPADSSIFAYDDEGRLLHAIGLNGIVYRTYYAGGALGIESQYVAAPHGGITRGFSLSYGYDLNGRRSSLSFDQIGGSTHFTQTYSYSQVTGALSSTTGNGTVTANIVRNGAGYPVSVSVPAASTTETRSYDYDGRMTARSHPGVSISMAYDTAGKMTSASTSTNSWSESAEMGYDGLGHLIGSYTSRGNTATQLMSLDGLGFRRWQHANPGTQFGERFQRFQYIATGAVYRVSDSLLVSGTPPYPQSLDETESWHNSAGDVIRTTTVTQEWQSGGPNYWYEKDPNTHTRSWYRSNGKLAAVQTSTDKVQLEEYFYDPLGRRVGVRLRRDSTVTSCGSQLSSCLEPVTVTYWDGDQVLAEFRAEGGWQVPVNQIPLESYGAFTGRAVYMHTEGIDQPVAVWRDPQVVVPGADWRGHYVAGSTIGNGWINSSTVWPGAHKDVFYAPDAGMSTPTPTAWLGSLLENQQDASGLVYRRNRYYDPQKGQFTQIDPIGIAGGLNLYGYAGGDPVNFSDPFGLWPDWNNLMRKWWKVKVVGRLISLLTGGGPDDDDRMMPPPPSVEQHAPTDKKRKTGSPPSPQVEHPEDSPTVIDVIPTVIGGFIFSRITDAVEKAKDIKVPVVPPPDPKTIPLPLPSPIPGMPLPVPE